MVTSRLKLVLTNAEVIPEDYVAEKIPFNAIKAGINQNLVNF